jgi:MEMO1 family protein
MIKRKKFITIKKIYLIIIFLLIFLSIIYIMNIKDTKNMFNAQVEGLFYPSNKLILNNQLNSFFKETEINYNGEKIKAIIAPHAGYIYSGKTAMSAYKSLYFSLLLEDIEEYKVIVLAPAHRTYFEDISILSNDFYKTPLTDIKIYYSKNLKKYENENAFLEEHSIEVQLPFIEYIFKKADKKYSVLPILIGDTTPEKVYKLIKPEITENTIIIVSSDLSHFLEDDSARKRDEVSIKNILENKTDIDACGKIGIETLNLISKDENLSKKLLKYTNSSEQTKDKKSVVGYASFSFYKEDKNILLKLAKKSIFNELNGLKDNFNDLKEILPKEHLEKQGVFVTLTINNNLRGCIGDIYSRESVFENVINSSKAAAFKDPRFNPLLKNEYEKIHIEISILSKPKESLLENIKEGEGVILSKGFNKAVYLPQVWTQLPNKEEFLGSLCEKAGLDFNCYKDSKTSFETFTVEIIE